MTEIKKCAHPACDCTVSDKDKYCTQYCEDAGDEVEISCDCGHTGCSLESPVVSKTVLL
jgi:hypothetical protein